MKRKEQLNEEELEELNFKKQMLYTILTSFLTVGVLVFALLSLNQAQNGVTVSKLYLGMTFLCLSLSKIPLVIEAKNLGNSKIGFIKNIVFASIYFILMILVFALESSKLNGCIICGVYLVSVVTNRICLCFERRKLSAYIFNGFLSTITLLLLLVSFALMGSEASYDLTLIACLLLILTVSLIDTLAFAFSRIQLKGIIKIMRKTYAFEILYGLVILVIASSAYFTIMEESIKTFADGLWYSFAVITTIGFGDYTVTGSVSRILSVVLGFYGLIVVAVITSIIINFYNESKDKKEDPKDDSKNEDNKG